MVIFHSYVSLPEGRTIKAWRILFHTLICRWFDGIFAKQVGALGQLGWFVGDITRSHQKPWWSKWRMVKKIMLRWLRPKKNITEIPKEYFLHGENPSPFFVGFYIREINDWGWMMPDIQGGHGIFLVSAWVHQRFSLDWVLWRRMGIVNSWPIANLQYHPTYSKIINQLVYPSILTNQPVYVQ